MARLHTRRQGKSKSRKPIVSEAKIDFDTKELEVQIASYAKQGMKPAMIGQNLKQKHKIGYLKPVLGKRLTQFMIDKGFKSDLPEDLLDLMGKAVNMRKYLAGNHRDVHNRIRLQRVESKIWRLSKYYRNTGRLPSNWKYDPEQAALIIK